MIETKTYFLASKTRINRLEKVSQIVAPLRHLQAVLCPPRGRSPRRAGSLGNLASSLRDVFASLVRVQWPLLHRPGLRPLSTGEKTNSIYLQIKTSCIKILDKFTIFGYRQCRLDEFVLEY